LFFDRTNQKFGRLEHPLSVDAADSVLPQNKPSGVSYEAILAVSGGGFER